MTILGELIPRIEKSGDKFFTGDRSGARALALWFYLYAHDMEALSKVEGILQSSLDADNELNRIIPSVANYHCEARCVDNTFFIFYADHEGNLENVILLSHAQFIQALEEYHSQLMLGIKNASPFLIEYLAEGEEALAKFKELGGVLRFLN